MVAVQGLIIYGKDPHIDTKNCHQPITKQYLKLSKNWQNGQFCCGFDRSTVTIQYEQRWRAIQRAILPNVKKYEYGQEIGSGS